VYAVVQNLSDVAFSFIPEYGGKYDVWIKVQNNGGFISTSNIKSVTGKEK
jgi:hypothetical protein